MERVLSTRIDDAVYRLITSLSVKLRTSKKAVIEEAIRLLERQYEQDTKTDVFEETCGIWNRSEHPSEIVSQIRSEFNASMKRH